MALLLPKANPIELFESDESGWYSEYLLSCYAQAYRPSDRTLLQLQSDVRPSELSAYLVDSRGLRVKDLPVTLPASSITGKYLIEVEVSFEGLRGMHMLRVQGISNARYDLCSRAILVAEHERTVLIAYRNSENTQGVIFSTGITFSLRVEGGFLPQSFAPGSDDTQYQNQDIDTVLLKSTPYDTFTFRAGGERGIPDRLMGIVNRAFSCDELAIDGVAMAKAEGAEWEAAAQNLHDRRTWSIAVTLSQNAFAKHPEGGRIGRWSSYICQRQSEPLDYIFVFAANEGTALTQEAAFGGATLEVDVTSLQADVFFTQLTATVLAPWLDIPTITQVPESNVLRLTVQVSPNADFTREGRIELRQNLSNLLIVLTVRQQAGSFPLTVSVTEDLNRLPSTVELTLDSGGTLSLGFTGTQEQTVHIPAERTVNTVRLTIDEDPMVAVQSADVSVQALPKLELDEAEQALPLPIDRSYVPHPPIGIDGSSLLAVTVAPNDLLTDIYVRIIAGVNAGNRLYVVLYALKNPDDLNVHIPVTSNVFVRVDFTYATSEGLLKSTFLGVTMYAGNSSSNSDISLPSDYHNLISMEVTTATPEYDEQSRYHYVKSW